MRNGIIVKKGLPFLGVHQNRDLEMTASKSPARTIYLLCRDVDRLDHNVEGALVEQGCAPTKVGHAELSRDVISKGLH